jgi:hypothetical protein
MSCQWQRFPHMPPYAQGSLVHERTVTVRVSILLALALFCGIGASVSGASAEEKKIVAFVNAAVVPGQTVVVAESEIVETWRAPFSQPDHCASSSILA